MTEIPEHLLKRSRDRKAAAEGGAPSESSPASTTPAASAPAAPKAAVPAKSAAPKPDSPVVAAAKNRKKIPFWAMATLSLLPLWAVLYVQGIKPAPKTVSGPLSVGAAVYGGCAGCHGANGAGGAGRQLSQGEVLKTFPHIEDMLNFVYTGSQAYAAAGLKTYGDPNREGGAHAPLAYNGNPMPQQGEMAGGALSEAEILAVVCHERYTIAGADPASEEYKSEYETWCSAESPIWLGLESGGTSFDKIEADFASLEKKPIAIGTKPRPGTTK